MKTMYFIIYCVLFAIISAKQQTDRLNSSCSENNYVENNWSEWSVCNVKCGRGIQTRYKNSCSTNNYKQQQKRSCFRYCSRSISTIIPYVRDKPSKYEYLLDNLKTSAPEMTLPAYIFNVTASRLPKIQPREEVCVICRSIARERCLEAAVGQATSYIYYPDNQLRRRSKLGYWTLVRKERYCDITDRDHVFMFM